MAGLGAKKTLVTSLLSHPSSSREISMAVMGVKRLNPQKPSPDQGQQSER